MASPGNSFGFRLIGMTDDQIAFNCGLLAFDSDGDVSQMVLNHDGQGIHGPGDVAGKIHTRAVESFMLVDGIGVVNAGDQFSVAPVHTTAIAIQDISYLLAREQLLYRNDCFTTSDRADRGH